MPSADPLRVSAHFFLIDLCENPILAPSRLCAKIYTAPESHNAPIRSKRLSYTAHDMHGQAMPAECLETASFSARIPAAWRTETAPALSPQERVNFVNFVSKQGAKLNKTGRSVQQETRPFGHPCGLIRPGQRFEIGWLRVRIVDPGTQTGAAIDHIDGQLVEHVLVWKIAPQRIVGLQRADGFKRQCHHAPRLKLGMMI